MTFSLQQDVRRSRQLADVLFVVAPSLTPESYNYLASNPALILTGAGLGAVFFTSKKQHLVSIDLFFLEIFRADQEPHVGELLFADLQAAY